MNHDTKLEVTTKSEHTVSLSNNDVIELLNKAGYKVPANAQVFVRVPGGGDWSNTKLDLGVDTQLTVVYSTVEKVPRPSPKPQVPKRIGQPCSICKPIKAGPDFVTPKQTLDVSPLQRADRMRRGLARLPSWIDYDRDAKKEILIQRLVHTAEQLEFGGQSKPGNTPGHWVNECMEVSALVKVLSENPDLVFRVIVGPDGQDTNGYLSR